MGTEYEIIPYNTLSFRAFIVDLLYRNPHFHLEFEFLTVLEGEAMLKIKNLNTPMYPGDIHLMNPHESHEIIACEPSLILSLQVHPSYFSQSYPLMEKVVFDTNLISDDTYPDMRRIALKELKYVAETFFRKEPHYEIKCAASINSLFAAMLDELPYKLMDPGNLNNMLSKGTRMKVILDYIDNHYTEKISLKDISDECNIDYYYASHYFRSAFGINFQDYLMRMRCEKVRSMLLLTDDTLLDICVESGISDMKYMKRGFEDLYGMSPKEYRKKFKTDDLPKQQKSILSTQKILSDQTSLKLLLSASS